MADGGSGSCLCGAVEYEVRGALRDVIVCHCGECRRMFSVHVRMWLCTEGASMGRVGRLRLKYEKAMRRVVEGRAGVHPAL